MKTPPYLFLGALGNVSNSIKPFALERQWKVEKKKRHIGKNTSIQLLLIIAL